MTTFAEQLEAARDSLRGSCVVAAALQAWPETDDLAAALAAPDIPPAAIAAASSGREPRLGTQAVAEHRAGTCACIIPPADPQIEA